MNYNWNKLFGRASPPEPPQRPSVEHWIELMVERLSTQFAPEKIVLFGSQARGEGDFHSDVDLLVVMQELDSRSEAEVEMHTALSGIPVPKDIVVTTPEEIERRGHLVGTVLRPALQEGKVLYARG